MRVVVSIGFILVAALTACSGRRTAEDDWAHALVERHQVAGDRVMLTGQDLGAHVLADLRSVRSLPPKDDYGVDCPVLVDLTGTKHVTCALHDRAKTFSQRMDIWVDSGFHAEPLDKVVDRETLGRVATMQVNEVARRKRGLPPNASVDCGVGKATIPFGGSITCTERADGTSYDYILRIYGPSAGQMTWEIRDRKPAHSSARAPALRPSAF